MLNVEKNIRNLNWNELRDIKLVHNTTDFTQSKNEAFSLFFDALCLKRAEIMKTK